MEIDTIRRLGRFFGTLLLLAALAVINCGCTARIEKLEQSVNTDISDVRSIQAQHTASIEEIRTELRALSGKIDDLQFAAVGKTKELERSLRRLGTRVPPPEGVPADLLQMDEEKIARLSGAAAEKYKNALSQLRSGDFDGARESFRRFVEENPGTAFTDNGYFWLGIVYTNLSQYDRAFVSFSEVYQSYPAEDMVPAALYYQAEALAKSGAPGDARLTLQKLLDEHKGSAFVRKAQARMKTLPRR